MYFRKERDTWGKETRELKRLHGRVAAERELERGIGLECTKKKEKVSQGLRMLRQKYEREET